MVLLLLEPASELERDVEADLAVCVAESRPGVGHAIAGDVRVDARVLARVLFGVRGMVDFDVTRGGGRRDGECRRLLQFSGSCGVAHARVDKVLRNEDKVLPSGHEAERANRNTSHAPD